MKKSYKWELYDYSDNEFIERYCHNCGKKVIFKNSGKKRHNANGNDIYEYAIYKCPRNHTWNMLLQNYKSNRSTCGKAADDNAEKVSNIDCLDLFELKKQGIEEIEIILNDVIGKWRLDKLLAEKIPCMSRNEICNFIKDESILIDGYKVKQGVMLKRNNIISILLKKI